MRYEKSFKIIFISVIAFHCGCILWCVWTGVIPPHKKTEKLIVKTIALNKLPPPPVFVAPPPPPPQPAQEKIVAMAEDPEPESEPDPEPTPPEPALTPSAPKPKPKPESKKENKKEVKPTPPKKETSKKETPKPKAVCDAPKKPPAKKTEKKAAPIKPQISKEDIKKQELIAKAQQIFSQKGTNKTSSDSKLISLGTISKLEIDSPGLMTDKERRYQDILASHLKDRLTFPEYGEVKIKLTLASSGKVIKVEIMSAKSEENRSYAVKTIPNILFPSFDTLIKENQHTFSVTLRND